MSKSKLDWLCHSSSLDFLGWVSSWTKDICNCLAQLAQTFRLAAESNQTRACLWTRLLKFNHTYYCCKLIDYCRCSEHMSEKQHLGWRMGPSCREGSSWFGCWQYHHLSELRQTHLGHITGRHLPSNTQCFLRESQGQGKQESHRDKFRSTSQTVWSQASLQLWWALCCR